MKPEEQRVVIAEACGWTGPFKQNEWLKEYDKEGGDVYAKLAGTDPLDGSRGSIRDYLNDLNAMHEAEKTLTDEQARKYVAFIISPLAYMPNGISQPAAIMLVRATAAQRAEAFLRAIGKWKE